MKYIDADKLIAEIEWWRDKAKENYNENTYSMGRCDALAEFRNYIVSLLEDSDFDDVDPNHLIHSHYTKVREIKTNREFWAEYSSEAAEWYEAGTGKAYSISDIEIVKEQPEVDIEKELKTIRESDEWRRMQKRGSYMVEALITVARHFYELGLNARKEE